MARRVQGDTPPPPARVGGGGGGGGRGRNTMVVSQHVTGGEPARSRMLTYHGAGLIRPQSAASLPRAEFLAWHKEQVFKIPPREL